MCPNQDTRPNWACTLICGAYAFGDPIQTIGEQAPQLNTETQAICTFIMRAKINTGQKENKLIKHNRKYEFGRLPGRYQILRQHIIEMETWSLLGARN
jgi:hypothetical protein